jgi:hypothetical protein
VKRRVSSRHSELLRVVSTDKTDTHHLEEEVQ